MFFKKHCFTFLFNFDCFMVWKKSLWFQIKLNKLYARNVLDAIHQGSTGTYRWRI